MSPAFLSTFVRAAKPIYARKVSRQGRRAAARLLVTTRDIQRETRYISELFRFLEFVACAKGALFDLTDLWRGRSIFPGFESSQVLR